jgi:hypothetical protein
MATPAEVWACDEPPHPSFDIVARARAEIARWRQWGHRRPPQVLLTLFGGERVSGSLLHVSTLGAWVEVGGVQYPVDRIARLEVLDGR